MSNEVLTKIEDKAVWAPTGGGGAFIVNVTMDENENYIADKTYSEISEALMNGQIPYCIFGPTVFYLMESDYLLTTYRGDISHVFLHIAPGNLAITQIKITDNSGVKLI